MKRDHHHEDTAAFKERFIQDVKRSTIFFLLILSRLIHFHQSIIPQYHLMKSIPNLEQTGQRQFEKYFEERLVLAKKPIDDVIKSNNMKLPR